MVKASRMPDFSAMGTIESELFQEVQRRLRYKNGNIRLIRKSWLSNG